MNDKTLIEDLIETALDNNMKPNRKWYLYVTKDLFIDILENTLKWFIGDEIVYTPTKEFNIKVGSILTLYGIQFEIVIIEPNKNVIHDISIRETEDKILAQWILQKK